MKQIAMTMTSTLPKPPRQLTGRMVLIALIAFFGIIIGVNLLMMKLAIDTLPGTEVDSAYGASLAFTSELASARAQATRDWKIDAHVARDDKGVVDVSVVAQDGKRLPLTGLTFSARLEWPADRRRDVNVMLTEGGNASYRGRIDGVPPGQWTLVLEADRADQRLFLSKTRVILE
jgi:nitrogen fixation protein FixH